MLPSTRDDLVRRASAIIKLRTAPPLFPIAFLEKTFVISHADAREVAKRLVEAGVLPPVGEAGRSGRLEAAFAGLGDRP